MVMSVLPYKDKELGKKEQVALMFDNIAHRYDFLNHFLSLGIDILWRKRAVRYLKRQQPENLLDIATGTGDFALEALAAGPKKIVGVDISEGMMAEGRKKLKAKGLDDIITLQYGDSENLPFSDNSFDAIIVAFGVRNFANLEKGLSEMLRVLRPGGQVVVLEFSQPTLFPFKQIYSGYFRWVLPQIGKVVSSDNAAYTYLPESVGAFPFGKQFTAILDKLGFKETSCEPLTFGISSIYVGKKP